MKQSIDDFLSNTAVPESAQDAAAPKLTIDDFLGQASAPAPVAPGPVGQKITMSDRLMQGVQDIPAGGAQELAHMLPRGVVDGINSATQYVNNLPVVGPITKALGMTPATPEQLDTAVRDRERQYQADRAVSGDTGIDGARMLGGVAATLPLAGVGAIGRGMGLLGRLGGGAISGGLNSSLQPITDAKDGEFGTQKRNQVTEGSLSGAILSPLASALGSAIKGANKPAQKALADAGVTMTPGQIMGGAAARTEEKLTSLPVIGDAIKKAQARSLDSFNTATYNDVLKPLGLKYGDSTGTDGVQAVKKLIGQSYDSALSQMRFNGAEPAFQQDLGKLANMAQALPDAQQKSFMNIVRTQISGKLGPQGTMDGRDLQGVQSELRRQAKGLMGDPSHDQRELGRAVGEVSNAIDASLKRTNAPEASDLLDAANASYARYARLRTAAGSQGAGNNGGKFTPAQLSNAVRSADKSIGRGNFATGQALMQDLSSNGMDVLGSKYPDSGTAGRSLLGTLSGIGAAAAAGGAAATGTSIPMLAGAAGLIGAGSLPYTAAGQRIMQALLMSRPQAAQPIGNAVSNIGGRVVPALAPALAARLQDR